MQLLKSVVVPPPPRSNPSPLQGWFSLGGGRQNCPHPSVLSKHRPHTAILPLNPSPQRSSQPLPHPIAPPRVAPPPPSPATLGHQKLKSHLCSVAAGKAAGTLVPLL